MAYEKFWCQINKIICMFWRILSQVKRFHARQAARGIRCTGPVAAAPSRARESARGRAPASASPVRNAVHLFIVFYKQYLVPVRLPLIHTKVGIQYFIKCASVLILLICLLWSGESFALTLNQRLSGFTSLHAKFVQTMKTPTGLMQSSGEFWIQKPGKFRWEVFHPTPQTFVSNGETVWDYEQDLSQVIMQPLTQRLGHAPLMLLSGTQPLTHYYNVKTIAPGQYFLTPLVPGGLVQSIEIDFSGNTLRTMVLVNSMGQKTTLTFHNIELNPTLSPSLFTFKVPQGVDVLK